MTLLSNMRHIHLPYTQAKMPSKWFNDELERVCINVIPEHIVRHHPYMKIIKESIYNKSNFGCIFLRITRNQQMARFTHAYISLCCRVCVCVFFCEFSGNPEKFSLLMQMSFIRRNMISTTHTLCCLMLLQCSRAFN